MTSSTSSKEPTPDTGAVPERDFEIILAKMIALAARNGVGIYTPMVRSPIDRPQLSTGGYAGGSTNCSSLRIAATMAATMIPSASTSMILRRATGEDK